MARHFVCPDTQVRADVPLDHFKWVGQAIDEYMPDTVVHLGDHWDMESVSRHSEKGSLDKEGKRLLEDLTSGNKALQLLDSYHNHVPKNKIILRGNHEHRLDRYVSVNPELQGLVGSHLFNDTQLGWDVVEYFNGNPGQREIDGVMYAHYFANPMTGKPISGTIQNRLAKIGQSFVQGHQQGLFQGNVQLATGRIVHGISAGSCYLHDETYKGVANSHWRGIVVLNEVNEGEWCEMPLTLNYLCQKYEGMPLNKYLRKKYKNAQSKYSLAK